MDDVGEFLVPYLPNVRVPQAEDRIHKDECCLSFDTPYTETGLYVCLKSFLSFGQKHVKMYHEATGNSVFLHLRKTPIEPKPREESTETEEQKPTRLALGVEGGFQANEQQKTEYEEINTITILPDFVEIPIENIEEIPAILLMSVQAVLSSESATRKEELLQWEGDVRVVSQHSNTLKQIDNDVRIPPSGWKCSRCDLTNNLWANLTDGTILCGRRYFDGTGGNEHALEYFRETGYPLVVKLGTITSSGADVFSYDEDDMVQDSNLAHHLAHFGINMMNMEKSEKTMTELEIDLNQKLGNEWEILQESGKQLKPLHGPHLTGMKNMGNTCYLNSTMQVLCSMDGFSEIYNSKCMEIFNKAIKDPASDFNSQMSKLLSGLSSGDYSKSPKDDKTVPNNGISPGSFKRLVGRGHPEFSSNRQQDAQEFLLHLLCLIERNSRLLGASPSNYLKFLIEERIECVQSKKVRYSTKPEYILDLPIPCHAAINKNEVEKYEAKKKAAEKDKSIVVGEQVRLEIPFTSCLEAFLQDDLIDDFWSPALQEKSTAKKCTRFASYPDYLVIQLKKFSIGDDWVPKKLQVSVNMPETLDLEKFRGRGLQEGEECLPDIEPPQNNATKQTVPQPQPNADPTTISQLVETGFPYEACVKAVHYTGNCGADMAMTWLMEHISDPDFSEPLQLTAAPPQPIGAVAGASSADPSEESINMIVCMGFTKDQAIKALKMTNNNLERAADWIFSHINELDTIAVGEGDNPNAQQEATPMEVPQSEESVTRDGVGQYELFAFISHMGSSTLCGHYVCHIKKDGKWVLFNDEKVAESENPPINLGYLYFYKRKVN
uniref:ubiquitin carboxyl-terminal hydrolase 5-like n=1 Tax=Styela clava TaxID=7725 RepID=UPI001939B1B7|nr:ubiquitin carboxyl-terminal hydrolase 5-like [Styela clava]